MFSRVPSQLCAKENAERMEARRFSTEIRGISSKDRTATFVISDESRDRHGTVIPIKAWDIESYNKNGIVAYQHEVNGSLLNGTDPDRIIGKGRVYVEGRKLIGVVEFESKDINPLAEKIWLKVQNGTLKAASVGFNVIEPGTFGQGDEARGSKNETYYFGRVSLLEWSIVNIPSNPNALKRGLESKVLTPYQVYQKRILFKHLK